MDEEDELLESIKEDFKCFTTEQLHHAVAQARKDIQQELGINHDFFDCLKIISILQNHIKSTKSPELNLWKEKRMLIERKLLRSRRFAWNKSLKMKKILSPQK